jgi:hypothetical protein
MEENHYVEGMKKNENTKMSISRGLVIETSFIHSSVVLQPFVVPSCVFISMIFRTVSKTSWTGSARLKVSTCTQDSTNRVNTHRHPCLEWVKAVHSLDRMTVMINVERSGYSIFLGGYLIFSFQE